MNHEIKFRAWDKENKVMYNWEDIKYIDIVTLQEKNILMQYTGLKDKNGKEIYEGDILEHEDIKGVFWEVLWLDCAFILQSTPIDNAYTRTILPDNILIFVENAEVVGNIYENPNLLEVDNNEG